MQGPLRRTALIILPLCLIIVLDSLLSPNFQTSVHDFVRENGNNILLDDTSLSDEERAVILGSGIESLIKELEKEEHHNNLRNRLEMMEEGFGGDDYDSNYITAQQKYAFASKMGWRLRLSDDPGGETSKPLDLDNDGRTYHNLIDSELPLPHYKLKGVVDSTLIYNDALAILVYDPANDKFVLSHSKRHPWNAENDELLKAFKSVSYLLRHLFPDRFNIYNKEFAIAISAGTFPHVQSTDCVKEAFQEGEKPCVESHFTSSPILHFGNVFSSEQMYPNIVPMPTLGSHLDCFRHWIDTATICDELQHLVYGDEGVNWDELSPEVFWRGEDFGYMASVPPGQRHSRSGLRSRHYKSIPLWEKGNDVPLAIQEDYSTLLSRWRGVLLTLESVSDLKRKRKETLGTGTIPWCNIRFNQYEQKVGYYKQWEKLGMPVIGNRIDQEELSKYRYHIDLGSDWELTLQQLAKPGLLFRQVSPTKEVLSNYMEPWVHYIPVAPQLNDLKTKFDWAESHPKEAKMIADRGIELAKYLTSSDGFGRMFKEDVVKPLRKVIDAYEPLSKKGHTNWREEMNKIYADHIVPVMNCSGRKTADCEEVVGKGAFTSTEMKRENCQIIYILGVEGSSHHGLLPIIENLAKRQIDPESGLEYQVHMDSHALKTGLFGWYTYSYQLLTWRFRGNPGVDDPALAQSVVSSMCPNDGKRHVIVEWASFPSGQANEKRSYRVKRQENWLQLTPEELANDELARVHPLDLNAFYDTYSPHADIKFIVLNRDYTETIASHMSWDGGPVGHSKIISGFMIILSRFLNSHLVDSVTGTKLWTLLCLESILAKNYQTEAESNEARRRVIDNMATFLGWPVKDCPECFRNWHESTKVPATLLGPGNMNILFDHVSALEGVWPPKRSDDELPEQQCGLLTKSTTPAVEDSKSSASTTVKIYAFGTRGKKAQSFFHSGLLLRFGTGRVKYVFEQRDDCNNSEIETQDSSCLAVNYFANPLCSYDSMRNHYSMCKTMLTNDENCSDNRYDARGYYSSTMTDMTYLPLGPRYDSWDAMVALMNQNGSVIAASSQRKYAFNAIFSISTHSGRSILAEEVQKEGNNLPSFIRLPSVWKPDPNNPSNDSVDSTTYMQVLLDSVFTLAPAGHNPECFRLYEAVEAGSIPVISLDTDYKQHKCKDSLSHWLDSPIVIVESWSEVIPTLQKLLEEPEVLDMRQADLRAWYNQYMSSAVYDFESFLLSET